MNISEYNIMEDKISFLDMVDLTVKDTEELLSIVTSDNKILPNGSVFETRVNQKCRKAKPAIVEEKQTNHCNEALSEQQIAFHSQEPLINGVTQGLSIDCSDSISRNTYIPHNHYDGQSSHLTQYDMEGMAGMSPLMQTGQIFVPTEIQDTMGKNVQHPVPQYNSNLPMHGYNQAAMYQKNYNLTKHCQPYQHINSPVYMPQHHDILKQNKNRKFKPKFKAHDITSNMSNGNVGVNDAYVPVMCIYPGYDPTYTTIPPSSYQSLSYNPEVNMMEQQYLENNPEFPQEISYINAPMQQYPPLYQEYAFPPIINGCGINNDFTNQHINFQENSLNGEINQNLYHCNETKNIQDDNFIHQNTILERKYDVTNNIEKLNHDIYSISDNKTEAALPEKDINITENCIQNPIIINTDTKNTNLQNNKEDTNPITPIGKKSKNKQRKKKQKNKGSTNGSAGDSSNDTRPATPTAPAGLDIKKILLGQSASKVTSEVHVVNAYKNTKSLHNTQVVSKSNLHTADVEVPKVVIKIENVPKVVKKVENVPNIVKKLENVPKAVKKMENIQKVVKQMESVPKVIKKIENVPKVESVPKVIKKIEIVPKVIKKIENVSKMERVPKVIKNMENGSRVESVPKVIKKIENYPKVVKKVDDAVNLPWVKQKSWSNVFGTSPNCTPISSPIPFETDGKNETISKRTEKISCNKIAETINKYKIGRSYNQLVPRGLINRSIWCYINSLLQSLIACPPFISLMQLLIQEIPHLETTDRFPFLSSFSAFIGLYSNVSEIMVPNFKIKSTHTSAIEMGVPCESTNICQLLSTVGGQQFGSVKQQDAQEALNFILNGLHEEILECLGTNSMMQTDPIEDGQDWQVKGPKGKTCVTRTTPFNQTPFSEIFWGELRYMQTVNGANSANIQPFNTLLLDIQSPEVKTLADAFNQLVCKEEIAGYTCSKTKQTTTVVKQVLLQTLPKILIIHLNRFTYGENGPLKYKKRVDFELELEIRKNLIYHNRSRIDNKSERTYTLRAVVKHEGPMATKGHYICEIRNERHDWLRCDDSNVKSITLKDVLKYDPSLVPYLLFYQRKDTISTFTNGNLV